MIHFMLISMKRVNEVLWVKIKISAFEIFTIFEIFPRSFMNTDPDMFVRALSYMYIS